MSSKCINLVIGLLMFVHLGNCTPASASSAELFKFWPDDYQTFQHVYGKTSDFEIFGDSLPSRVVDKGRGTTDDNFKYQPSRIPDAVVEGSNDSPNQARKKDRKQKRRTKIKVDYTTDEIDPASSFVDDTDDETLAYLKQVQQLGAKQNINFPQANVGGFKPYSGLPYINYKSAFENNHNPYKSQEGDVYLDKYLNPSNSNYKTAFENNYNAHKNRDEDVSLDKYHNPYNSYDAYKNKGSSYDADKVNGNNYDSYKSIQDIIDSEDTYEDHDTVYGKPKDYKPYGNDVIVPFKSKNKLKAKPPTVPVKSGSVSKPRAKCSSSVCRNRSNPTSSRYRSVRPRVRKIKKVITYE